MDDADAHIYTTTIMMHGEQEVKTKDDDHNILIRGALQARIEEVINQELSKTLGTRKPHHLCQICPTKGNKAHICKKRTSICSFANMNKMCSSIFVVYFSTLTLSRSFRHIERIPSYFSLQTPIF
jgi:hypothetical protein